MAQSAREPIEDPLSKSEWLLGILGIMAKENPFAEALLKLTPDEYAAYVFLAGYPRYVRAPGAPRGRVGYCNIETTLLNGDAEKKGRQALVRLLRDGKKPVPDLIRGYLAALFAGENEWRCLQLVLRRGRHRSVRHTVMISVFVQHYCQEHSCKQEAAISAAKNYFGVSERNIRRALAEWRSPKKAD